MNKRERDRERKRQTDRQRYRRKQTERDRGRDTETHRQRQRDTETDSINLIIKHRLHSKTNRNYTPKQAAVPPVTHSRNKPPRCRTEDVLREQNQNKRGPDIRQLPFRDLIFKRPSIHFNINLTAPPGTEWAFLRYFKKIYVWHAYR